MQDLPDYCQTVARQARQASRQLAVLTGADKIAWLRCTAKLIRQSTDRLLAGNAKDIQQAPGYGLTDAMIDRLRLSPKSLEAIAGAVEQIVLLPDPVGQIRGSQVRPNGLLIKKVAVPLGVVFFIFESRPNVTVDAAALCVKSGNAVILRGGKEAFHSNLAFYEILKTALRETGLPEHAVQLVETTDRDAVGHFLKLNQYIDVTIPRGGKGLIERVSREASMPVIKHFDGNCHVFVDAGADQAMAERILINSKCQRPGVCNAAESLLVHEQIAREFLPRIEKSLTSQGVELRGCPRTREVLPDVTPATEEDHRAEFLDLILSVKVVSGVQEAIEHINEYGSHHTESIITRDLRNSELFTAGIDSAAVMVNASTRFNDGGEFGLGAEIGISTDKFHARGPCGLEELTSYKYIVQGSGQIRE